MSNMNESKKIKIFIFSAVGILLLIALLSYMDSRNNSNNNNFLGGPTPSIPADDKMSLFAQCLTEKGFIMYGAYWCSHCQSQKKLFGDSFKYVSYVECTKETKKCSDAGVVGYPTWILSEKKFEGEQSLEKLSQESSCPLPFSSK